MSFELTDPQFTPGSEPATTNLWHDLRTPLAVIRMQAQLLMRLTSRGSWRDASDRERYLAGLHRIDDAVTKIDIVLERARTGARDERSTEPGMH